MQPTHTRFPFSLLTWATFTRAALTWATLSWAAIGSAQSSFRFEKDDRVCLLGNALAERMQHHGWLETRLQQRLPELELVFRNLGFSADTLTVQQRTDGFGSWDDHLAHCRADVILAFFGYVESFDGVDGLDAYRADLAAFIEARRARRYDGEKPPRIVLFTPVACEDQKNPYLPDPALENLRISAYAEATVEVARAAGVPCVDLFVASARLYRESDTALTIDGIHLNAEGNRLLAEVIEQTLLGHGPTRGERADPEALHRLRQAVLRKNLFWFNRHRATDGYNVYGGRSSLAYIDDQTNYEVLQRELHILDAMCEREDLEIHALARGETFDRASFELPEPIPVPTNRPGPEEGGAYAFLSGTDAIANMTVPEGMRVELFADETDFPELVNPVQMAWDTRGRLWVAVWPTYPHWEPSRPLDDKLLILEDTDGDGRADRSTAFADDLHNPTGFEFWNGGVLVANAPDLLFLQDTDGDDRADRRERLLGGLSSADTHHSANSFVIGPAGALYFQEGTFHMSQVESVRGPVRNQNGCVWRFDPRTHLVERYVAYDFANPHGHVFDDWGQDFVTDGTGNVNYYALPFSGHLESPDKHRGYFPFFPQRSRPSAATEILSSAHFPAEAQGNYLIANVIGFQGIFQYELLDDGAGFTAKEVTPLVQSTDPNFRPVDLEVGPDGAVYFLDWHNPLIGHMQHHLRDPSRDQSHGRVYRIRMADRPLLEPVAIAGQPVGELFTLFESGDARVRYRARLELGGRPREDVIKAARHFASAADRGEAGYDHQRLEALWVQAQHDVLDEDLVRALLAADDPRARAAATRVVRHLRHRAEEPLALLKRSVLDPDARVRLEAIVALSFFSGRDAAELALAAVEGERDRFGDYALQETLRALEPTLRAALVSGELLGEEHPEGLRLALTLLNVDDLFAVRPGPARDREILSRHGLDPDRYAEAATALGELEGTSPLSELVLAIERADARSGGHTDHLLSSLFRALDSVESRRGELVAALRVLAAGGKRSTTRRLALAARMEADASIAPAWDEAGGDAAALADLLDATPFLRSRDLIAAVAPRVIAYMEAPPAPEASGAVHGRICRIDLPGPTRTLTLAEVEVFSRGVNVALDGSASQPTEAWGGVPARGIDGNTSGAWGDGGQTHTVEDMPDPWWEVDLGRSLPIDAIVLWNRTDGSMGERLNGYRLSVLDEDRRVVFETTVEQAGAISDRIELEPPSARTRRGAVRCLGGIAREGIDVARIVPRLAFWLGDPALRHEAVLALSRIAPDTWPAETRQALGLVLTGLMESAPKADFETETGRALLVLTDLLLPHLEADESARLAKLRAGLGVRVVLIGTMPDSMLYDRTDFQVLAGRTVELVFRNDDLMPHNLVVAARGALARVGLAAEAMAALPDAWERAFVPDLDEVLFATPLLQPGETATLRFTAPSEPGDYPYVCTFPGHWVRMNGIMHVVLTPDLEGTGPEAAADAPASAGTGRPFVASWKPEDLASRLPTVDGRNRASGRAVLEAASCLKCHAIDGEGKTTGPDLTEVVSRYSRAELLEHILRPSALIAEGYESDLFFTTDGRIVAGHVVEEDAENVYVQDDPYRDDELVLPRTEIEERVRATISTMPEGLLSTFQRDEILDLLAYLEGLGGD